jgi:hypothetical protein
MSLAKPCLIFQHYLMEISPMPDVLILNGRIALDTVIRFPQPFTPYQQMRGEIFNDLKI